MKTMDLLVRFKARLKANQANKEALKRILKAVAYVQDSSGERALVLKPPETNRDEAAEEAAAPPPARAKASRFTGVRRDKGHWRASIRVRGSPVHLGEFDDEEDAARTYDAARVKYKGAPTVNFPGEAPLASVLAALPALPSPPPAQPAPAPPPPGVIALSSNDDGAELTEAEVRGALQAAGGRMKTRDLLERFKARLKANPANKDAIKRILRAVAVLQDSAGGRVLVLKAE